LRPRRQHPPQGGYWTFLRTDLRYDRFSGGKPGFSGVHEPTRHRQIGAPAPSIEIRDNRRRSLTTVQVMANRILNARKCRAVLHALPSRPDCAPRLIAA